ncbi:gamma carbonic anhydrase family protein [Nakamurella lactea]|uniref:gamma carbonic anhydrase family protein n=1 Tax=Nakamurella lactea TaxID=459515 RepID=UPI0003FB93EC|nr:gamma carbonic anhydrase family protein [Nakamurella lactea]
MIIDLPDRRPQIHESAWIAPTATIVGGVSVAADASIWYGVVLRADSGPIEIGAGSNVQDNSVMHTDEGLTLRIGRRVTVGHGAIVHGADIDDDVLIGMGAVLLNHCRIGSGSIVGAGAVVSEGAVIPPNSLVLGVPGKVRRQTTDAERERIAGGASGYVDRARQHRQGSPR